MSEFLSPTDGSPYKEGILHLDGVGIILLNSNKALAAVQERKSNIATEKTAGQYSIPLETAKSNGEGQEPVASTLLGAMGEVVNDEVLQEAGSNFRLVLQPPRVVPVNHSLRIGLFFVIFTGDPDYQLKPFAHEEVESVRWSHPHELLSTGSNLRSFARLPLEKVQSDALIDKAFMLPTSKLFPDGFSIQEFFQRRELNPDIVLGNRNIVLEFQI